MREAYIWLAMAFLAGIIVGTVFTAYQANPNPNPKVMEVDNIQRLYTILWNGQNTTLTLVFRDGNSTTTPVINGQQFICNASTRVYEGNRLLYQFP